MLTIIMNTTAGSIKNHGSQRADVVLWFTLLTMHIFTLCCALKQTIIKLLNY